MEVRDLACDRGGVPVLEGVSFSLAPGEALVLRGPNGAGKTTLLRTVAGLQPPAAGTIVGASGVAYAGHADGIKAQLSVAENLAFWAGVYGVADISAALSAFRLEPLASRHARDLSAGQKRRIGLARLLLTGRALWALDEPTVSLDRDAVALFARAIRSHLASGGMALIASHIDLGLDARDIDIVPYRARPGGGAFDEALA